MTVTLYTLEVISGDFKGKTVQSFDMPQFVYGMSSPYLACFDDDAEYCLFWGDVKEISREEIEVPETIDGT